jgi:hypothetical protein
LPSTPKPQDFQLFQAAQRRTGQKLAVEFQPSRLFAEPGGTGLVRPDLDAECRHDVPQGGSILRDLAGQGLKSAVGFLAAGYPPGQFGAQRRAGEMVVQVDAEQPRAGLPGLFGGPCRCHHPSTPVFLMPGRPPAPGAGGQSLAGLRCSEAVKRVSTPLRRVGRRF